MSNKLKDAINQANDLMKVVNEMIPQAESLVSKALSEATSNLKGKDLKDTQKKIIQIKELAKKAKTGTSIDKEITVLIAEVKERYPNK